jgi:acyl-coenzyme A thioesterase PaaI-like protein
VLTVDFGLDLLAPATGDELVDDAAVVRLGWTLTVCSFEGYVLAEDGPTHVATGRQTVIRLADTPDGA